MFRIAALLALVACLVRLPTASAKVVVVPYEATSRRGYVYGAAPEINGVETYPSKSVRWRSDRARACVCVCVCRCGCRCVSVGVCVYLSVCVEGT